MRVDKSVNRPNYASSVVLILFDTALIVLSTKLFKRLDFPAFGAPNIQIYKDLAPYGDSLHGTVRDVNAASGI